MDYGKIFTRAWETLWNNAFLIILGVIAALGGDGYSGASQGRLVFRGREMPWQDMPWQDMPSFEFDGILQSWDLSAIAVGGIILLVIALVLFGLVIWALGLVARGGMIHAVNELESGRTADFSSAFQTGWDKGWKLLVIGLVPAIPGLILLVTSVSVVVFSGVGSAVGAAAGWPGMRTLAPLIFLFCLFVPIMLLFSVLQSFANRACMLEGTGVIDSYRRALEVLGANLGPALILFLLQVVINIALGILFFIPSILAAMCCLLWPLLIIVQAAFVAFYSVLWTLAWREWVGYAEVIA